MDSSIKGLDAYQWVVLYIPSLSRSHQSRHEVSLKIVFIGISRLQVYKTGF